MYFTFDYMVSPVHYGNNAPLYELYDVNIDLFAPEKMNTLALRRQVRDLLERAGFTRPSEVNASDNDGQHYIFECEVAEWIGERSG